MKVIFSKDSVRDLKLPSCTFDFQDLILDFHAFARIERTVDAIVIGGEMKGSMEMTCRAACFEDISFVHGICR